MDRRRSRETPCGRAERGGRRFPRERGASVTTMGGVHAFGFETAESGDGERKGLVAKATAPRVDLIF